MAGAPSSGQVGSKFGFFAGALFDAFGHEPRHQRTLSRASGQPVQNRHDFPLRPRERRGRVQFVDKIGDLRAHHSEVERRQRPDLIQNSVSLCAHSLNATQLA